MAPFNEWKKESESQQENLSNSLGDRIWDEFEYPDDDDYIFKKIAVPLLGSPKKESKYLGFNQQQIDLVNNIKDKCINHSVDKKKIRLAVIFVFVYMDDKTQTVVPLIRVMTHTKECLDKVPNNVFVDHLGRVYDMWASYQNDNTWNKCWLCVPKNGYYSHNLDVVFLDQSSRGEVLEIVDKVSMVTNIGTSVGMIAGTIMCFFPPTAPIGAITVTSCAVAGAPGAAYGVGRSVGRLADRVAHEQSISLSDSEARQCWLMTATSLISVGAMGSARLLASTARAGNLVSSTTRVMCTALNVTSISMSGLGVINSFYELSQKKEITPLDVFQLTTSIFFFTHSVCTFQTASSIIKQAQKEQIAQMSKNLTPEQKQVHDALLQGSRENIEKGKVREMHGNAKFIKEMKKIDNVGEFLSHFQIKADGQLHVNSELTIHPRAFVQLTEADRIKLVKLSEQLNNQELSLKDFNKQTVNIQKEFKIRLDQQRAEGQTYLQDVFGVGDVREIDIGGTKLGDVRPEALDRLEHVLKHSFNGDKELLEVAKKMAEKQGATNVSEFCAAGEYAVRKVQAEVKARQAENPNPTRPKGIKAKNYYKSQVVEEYLKNDARMNDLSESFSNLRTECDAANTGTPKFNNSMAAANHYDKHAFFPRIDARNNLSSEMYFNIATEMAGGPVTDIKWTQDGSCLKCTFKSEKYGAVAIRYDNLANGTSVIATLMAEDGNVIDARFYNNSGQEREGEL